MILCVEMGYRLTGLMRGQERWAGKWGLHKESLSRWSTVDYYPGHCDGGWEAVNEGTRLPKQLTLSLQHGLRAGAHGGDHGSQSKTVHDRTGTTGWDCWRAGSNYQYCNQVCMYSCVYVMYVM
jgi:hypothetical protein